MLRTTIDERAVNIQRNVGVRCARARYASITSVSVSNEECQEAEEDIYYFFFLSGWIENVDVNHGCLGGWWQLKQVIEIKQTTYLNQTQISLILK